MQGTLLNGSETSISSGVQYLPSQHGESHQDPYRGVVIFLSIAAFLGAGGALAGGLLLSNPVLLDTAVVLGLATRVLIGVAVAQAARVRPPTKNEASSVPLPADETEIPVQTDISSDGDSKMGFRLTRVPHSIWKWFRGLGATQMVKVGTAIAGVLAIGFMLLHNLPTMPPSTLVAGVAVAICLAAAGLAATAAHYLADIDPARFPEATGLCRGARVVAWILVVAAVSMALSWGEQETILRILHFAVLTVVAAVCYSLLTVRQPEGEILETFPLDFGALTVLGSRSNILASVLDTAEQQLGIDLRSTWALTVVREGLEPLIIGLFLMGWLSTSFTVVGLQEEGLVERLGVPLEGQPLQPGLHLHWPWPVDQVFRIPVLRVQALQVGHEGEEAEGPENVLWAREHAPNEFTLLLGNGRDLITVDAAVQYRVVDPRAWRYHTQNPADALKAIAYRAVMRSTVNRTLAEALSENVVTLTEQIRGMVQKDADDMGLGAQVLNFTIGGMHPPVPVADAYEGVVSAELGKVTAVVDAQAYRNQTVPAAEASAIVDSDTARGEGAQALALAAGEAWSFRTLESQYKSAPEEYLFRRRLETLENGLALRRYTVVDSRFQRDGGEIWLTQ